MSDETQALTDALFANMQSYVERATAPLLERIKELETDAARVHTLLTSKPDWGLDDLSAEVAKRLPAPKDGEPGQSVTLDDVGPLIADAVAAAVAALPVPKDGEPGKSVTTDDIAPLVEAAMAEAVAAIPTPKDGEPGKDAEPVDINAIVDAAGAKCIEAIQDWVSRSLDDAAVKAVSALPVPKDGEPGKDIDPVEVQAAIVREVEKAVAAIPAAKDGDPGKDGVGAAGALIDRDGNLVLTMTDGRTCNLGRVVGKDAEPAEPGKPGKDGFGFDDLTVTHDGDRTVTLSFQRGAEVKAFTIDLPVMIYRGVFSEGQFYQRGDTVTWGGSLWHCEEETALKPDDGTKSWKLAAKRGRDGKPGEPGKPGAPGKPGERGKNLTPLGAEGMQ